VQNLPFCISLFHPHSVPHFRINPRTQIAQMAGLGSGSKPTRCREQEAGGDIMEGLTIVDHPLVQHKLTLIRDKDRSTKSFRELLKEIGMLLCYEVTRDLPLTDVEIETPLARMTSRRISGKKLVFAPVLRAGLTFAEGMLDLVPAARVAHIGLYREPETFVAVEYFFKAPSDLNERLVIVVVPLLATANTAVAAVDRLKERGAKEIRLVCLIGAPQGVERMRGVHPDVPIWAAAIDDTLDERAFIVPGLGDAGDRAYGTK
jgi:uracil phosphoribosyltransferase